MKGEYLPLKRVGSRVYQVAQGTAVVGHNRIFLEDLFESSLRVESIIRNDENNKFNGFTLDELH